MSASRGLASRSPCVALVLASGLVRNVLLLLVPGLSPGLVHLDA